MQPFDSANEGSEGTNEGRIVLGEGLKHSSSHAMIHCQPLIITSRRFDG